MKTLDLNYLKKQSKFFYKDLYKEIIYFYDNKIDDYNIGAILNYITEKNMYEVFCFIENYNILASGLKNRLIKNKALAILYFNYLQFCLEKRGLKFFFKI